MTMVGQIKRRCPKCRHPRPTTSFRDAMGAHHDRCGWCRRRDSREPDKAIPKLKASLDDVERSLGLADDPDVHLPGPDDSGVWPRRPRTRGDCLPGGCNEKRPCAFISCRHHAALDVWSDGSVRLTHPNTPLEDMPYTCTLDVADDGEASLYTIGVALNISRERVRQIEGKALKDQNVRELLAEHSNGAEGGGRYRPHVGWATPSDEHEQTYPREKVGVFSLDAVAFVEGKLSKRRSHDFADDVYNRYVERSDAYPPIIVPLDGAKGKGAA